LPPDEFCRGTRPKEGRELSTRLEDRRIGDARGQGSCGDDADARDRFETLAGCILSMSCCRFRGHEDKIVTKELESGYDETEVYA